MSHRNRTPKQSVTKYINLQAELTSWLNNAKSRKFVVIVVGDMNAIYDQSQRSGETSKADTIFQRIKTTVLQDSFSLVHRLTVNPTWVAKGSADTWARLNHILIDRNVAHTLKRVEHSMLETTS